MSHAPSATYCRADGTIEMMIEDHTVVVDRNGEQMVTLNSVGGLIWDRLDQQSSLDDLVDLCGGAYPQVTNAQLHADVRDFLMSAVEIGVVVATDS